jgi:hypothetical protein
MKMLDQDAKRATLRGCSLGAGAGKMADALRFSENRLRPIPVKDALLS